MLKSWKCYALLVTLMLAGTQALAALPGMQMTRLRVTLAANSTVATAVLYIDNQNKGTIVRGQAKEFVNINATQVKVRLQNGAAVAEQQVRLIPGRWVEVTLPLVTVTTGAIRVIYGSGPVSASCYLDGAYRGGITRGTAKVFAELQAGSHNVKIQSGLESRTETVIVRENQTSDVSISLREPVANGTIRAGLSRDSATIWAQVNVNGANVGRVLRGSHLDIVRPAGACTVQMTSGTLNAQQDVIVQAGATVAVNISLRPVLATLTVALAPDSGFTSATLYVNGAVRGSVARGTATALSLVPGTYTVRLAAGAASEETSVTLATGEARSVSLKLVQPRGTLTISHAGDSAVDSGRLFVNAAQRGQLARNATTTLELDPGTYTIELRNGQLSSGAQSVTVTAGQTSSVVLTVIQPKGTLSVNYSGQSAYATAEVFINGTQNGSINRGTTSQFTLDPGTYTIELRNGQISSGAQSVTVTSGQTANVVLTLVQPKGTLSVNYSGQSAYATAEVFINGTQNGTINRGNTAQFTLDPGTYNVMVRANNQQAMQTVTVIAGQTATASLVLATPYGTLAVTLDPASTVASATVFIDGNSRATIARGQTLTFTETLPGTHSVRLSSGAIVAEQNVLVSLNQTSSANLLLKQDLGTLQITLLPQSRALFARVLINGVYRVTVNRGQTVTLTDMAPGVYNVRIDGGRTPQDIRQTVTIGAPSRIVLNLN